MADGYIQINEGSGKKLAYYSRTDANGDTVYNEKGVQDQPFIPTYVVQFSTALAMSVANAHVWELMAGASKRVILRRLRLWQVVVATAAAIKQWELVTLTSAGTGGGTITPRSTDPADGAAGATCMTAPTVKGTEANIIGDWEQNAWTAVPTTGLLPAFIDESWTDPYAKPPTIAAGTSNGLALKLITSDGASPTVRGYMVFQEVVNA